MFPLVAEKVPVAGLNNSALEKIFLELQSTKQLGAPPAIRTMPFPIRAVCPILAAVMFPAAGVKVLAWIIR